MGKQYWKPGNMLYPVPAVMVSCQRGEEKPNIITLAWAGTISSNPAMLSVSIRKERYSHDIIKQSGEFVVNLVTKDTVYATDYCGVKSGRDIDKFKKMKLTPIASKHIKAPSIEECPVNIELELIQSVEIGTHTQMIGKILDVKINKNCLNGNDAPDILKAAPLLFDPGQRSYYGVGEFIAKAFSIGKRLTESAD